MRGAIYYIYTHYFLDLLDVTWAVKHYSARAQEGRVGSLRRRRIVYSDPAHCALSPRQVPSHIAARTV